MANSSRLLVVAALLWVELAYSLEVELDLPGCEPDAFPRMATLFLLNAACEAAAPDTGPSRAAELKKAKEQYPGCFRAIEQSAEHMEFLNRVTAETKVAKPNDVQEMRESCKVYFNAP